MHRQNSQNSNFVIFLQHLNREERNLVDFLQTLLYKLLILLILVGMANLHKITSSQKLCDIPKI